MEKLNSTTELDALQKRLKAARDPGIPVIVLTAGTCGQASGANDLIRATKRELIARNMTDKIGLRITGCLGFCEMEPSVLLQPSDVFYPKVRIQDIPRIIDSVMDGTVIEELLYVDPSTGKRVRKQNDIPFFKGQRRKIIGQNEDVDPIRIEDYLRSGGYGALAKVLERGDRKWVVDEVKASGLRGRGGAGFPTGLKWELLAKQPDGKGKYMVCNADEGDPGAYMDRSVLEGNPHSVIEGMIIGAYGTGATEGIVYVRNEYPLAIKHLIIALGQAREHGLLGPNILGSDFSFDIRIVRGAGAFVCGEETAMISSIEGKAGEPRQRPPFPVQSGIYGRPTAINNVETWANVPVIIRDGAAEYSKVGAKGNSGTKIFSLVGKIRNTGLVEVPMGTPIEKIIYEIGGGHAAGKKIKAVQTGGPSGGCIPANLFDLPIDYDSLTKAGSIMGSGGMIVMDENTCMVDLAKYFMNFLKDESCGKCYTCRKGTQRMYEILDDITKGRGTLESLELLEELANVVKDTTMCGLGQTAANPVLSTIRYFRHEYLAHINDLTCPAGVCKELVGAPCQSACPVGTEAWRYVAHIARGENEEAYRAIREPNPFPSVCARVCNHPCEAHCRAGTGGGEAISIRALKRFITDNTDPSVYTPKRLRAVTKDSDRVAVVGAGPAGLTAAHQLSLMGYKVTLFEKEGRPGGMLLSTIPEYRLPKKVVEKEIQALLDENMTVECNKTLGADFTLAGLFADGYKAVFLALGAHKSRALGVEGENLSGVYSSMDFLKEFNLNGKAVARGRVGVVGGGNSAVDAARVALRQRGVTGVTIYYRRTREEMPAFREEVDAAIEEGVRLEVLTTPVRVLAKGGNAAGVELRKNRLGEMDSSGRRRPVEIPGSEYMEPVDTLITAISESPELDFVVKGDPASPETTDWGTLKVDPDTLCTSQAGVFAGGDVVRGPNTVVEAIADGKKAAVVIDRYLRGQELKQPKTVKLPSVYVAQVEVPEEEGGARRVETPHIPIESRKKGFAEVERPFTAEQAKREARRCLRCDLEFTESKREESATEAN
ncbi:MAG: NADH-quinone oxidoreductase subunit NuoF [Candidatus Eisenbacteria bacterium]|nr:NADH-quinone oxidoreductase subunit NuoF [Candidatus Eisenbacteria bacterium]